MRESFVITFDGKPAAAIILGDEASSTEEYAAEELQYALERMSGAKLPIVRRSAWRTGSAIVIGTRESVPDIAAVELFGTGHPEEVRIATSGEVLFLAGPTPRGALYATYTFLQDVLGARWFWPGSSGEFLPRRSTIFTGDLDIREVPSIELRTLAIGSLGSASYDQDTTIWMARNRLNLHGAGLGRSVDHRRFLKRLGFLLRMGGHQSGTLPLAEFEEHPEYMAEYGGARQIPPGQSRPHLDWSNPGAQAALAEQIAETWDRYPEIDFVAFYGPDHQYYCDCAACRALAPDVSTRWQRFSMAVMEHLNETRPGKKYHTLAYQGYRPVPADAADWDMVGYTAYNLNYTKPITDPTNAAVRRDVLDWTELGVPMGLRGYHFVIFNEPAFVPQTSLIVEEIAWAAKTGLKAWWSEVAPYGWPPESERPQDQWWVANRMALYAAAQATWNADLDPDALVRDWASAVFGPAGEAMFGYYQLMDDAWRSTPGEITYFTNPVPGFVRHFMSQALLHQAERHFQDARRALGTVKDAEARRRIGEQIRLEEVLLEKWRRAFRVQQGLVERFEVHVPRADKAPTDGSVWEGAARLPAFVDGEGSWSPRHTEVLATWDAEALYLRFVVRELSGECEAVATQTLASGLQGEFIELFVEDPSDPTAQYYLAVDRAGTRHASRIDFALEAKPELRLKWHVHSRATESLWTVDVTLPFASFGFEPGTVSSWRMAFRRDGADPRTGWPDASYLSPSGLGALIFVDAPPKRTRVALFNLGRSTDPSRVDALRSAFSDVGITMVHAETEQQVAEVLAQGVDAFILRHPNGSQVSDAWVM